MKKLHIWAYAALAASVLFSLFCLSFSADISLLAFPLSTGFTAITVFYAFFRLFRRNEFKAIFIVRKLLQYLPFVLLAAFILRRAGKNGTAYWNDVTSVLLWCAVFISSLGALHYLNEKRVYELLPEWKSAANKAGKPLKGGVRIVYEILDWVDALVQAVFMVLLIQIFIIQLYVIPSESMVPEFLVKDRVVVFKTSSGPKFPLSDVGLPCLKSYSRGDVIVFRNPHYNMDRKSEVRTVVSQIIYMLSFTGINLNVDASGQPKADPLVKRICGVPGEQLMMQDGVLYVRTKDSDIFKAAERDAEFAAWNLNSVKQQLKRGIQLLPISQKQYDLMLEVEEDRRSLDIDSAAFACRALAAEFERLHVSGKNDLKPEDISMYEYDMFSFNKEITKMLMASADGKKWFRSFMTDWTSGTSSAKTDFAGDLYAEANYKLNLMIKMCIGKIIVRNAELAASGVDPDSWFEDSMIMTYITDANRLNLYVMLLDQRNMPVFPASESDGTPNYIPDGCYFMMGDNRFNSLDMRHSYTQKMVPLTEYDKYSVKYYSNIAPQYVNKKYILGTAAYRFWPLGRHGTVKTK